EAALAQDNRFTTNSQRVEKRSQLVPLVETIMKRHTTAEWQQRLTKAGVPHAPVWDYAELFAHPQAQARGLRVTVHDPQGQSVDLLGSPFHISGIEPPSTT